MAKYYALTTSDNPYNPRTQFDEWYALDTQLGYNCCSYLARMIDVEGFTPAEQNEVISQAIDDIIENDPLGVYVKFEYEA